MRLAHAHCAWLPGGSRHESKDYILEIPMLFLDTLHIDYTTDICIKEYNTTNYF